MIDEFDWNELLEPATVSASKHHAFCSALLACRLRARLTRLAASEALVAASRFLGEYAMRLPERLREAPVEVIDWQLAFIEETAPTLLPLQRLHANLGVARTGRWTLLGAGLVEDDARFGDLYARLQGGMRRPALETLGRLFVEDDDPWRSIAPLIDLGLLTPSDREVPRAEWTLSVPRPLWDVLRGDRPQRGTGVELVPIGEARPLDAVVMEPKVRERLDAALPLLERGDAETLVLRGAPGTNVEAIAAGVARHLGRSLLTIDARDDGAKPGRVDTMAALLGALPLMTWDLAPGETVVPPDVVPTARPLLVGLGPEGGIGTRYTATSLSIALIPLRSARRAKLWKDALGDGGPWEELADHFHLGGAYLERLAELTQLEARLSGGAPTLETAIRASRQLQHQHLDKLAERIEVEGGWDRVIVGAGTNRRLRELELRCRERERILSHLGRGFSGARTRGVRALFSGASGTGKTLAARTLASVLKKDLYRVELSAVVNKFIGETEKNLHRVLSYAEALDVVLLLDEGDALLGGRTEVRSANDRYANLETNYLLQRIESYDGVLVVTTNEGDNIDRAFRRRMDVIVPFVSPRPVERYGIWQLHLPDDHEVSAARLDAIAHRFVMTGAEIRNAVEHATLLALENGVRVDDTFLERGLKSEREKAGALWPSDAPPTAVPVEPFFSALRR